MDEGDSASFKAGEDEEQDQRKKGLCVSRDDEKSTQLQQCEEKNVNPALNAGTGCTFQIEGAEGS